MLQNRPTPCADLFRRHAKSNPSPGSQARPPEYKAITLAPKTLVGSTPMSTRSRMSQLTSPVGMLKSQ
ncbi:hypothetical protein EJ03DRAFT_26404 [Teratosphaeria nubilosa]|uniref:Uncharacterized protein n=1 Tax=Teratosphaeria nubilosa TaxID=161662 RepID=A0A6G1KV87_9PEZI|nr:hypothetical protein EJ03DRAFT_26404 [Teratosphaeria nubilosa]